MARTKVLQAKLEDEAEAVLNRLKSKSLKSFFVNQAIIHFSQSDKGEMFLKEDTQQEPVKKELKQTESVKQEKQVEIVREEKEEVSRNKEIVETKMPEW